MQTKAQFRLFAIPATITKLKILIYKPKQLKQMDHEKAATEIYNRLVSSDIPEKDSLAEKHRINGIQMVRRYLELSTIDGYNEGMQVAIDKFKDL